MLARQMEVYAGFLEHTDHHVGRLVDALEDLGVLEDTLVYYIVGDNGASAEGTINGTFNEMFVFNGAAALETPEFVASRIDEFGTPTAYNHFAVGWAHAMDTPYQWTKQVASHWGGTRNGTIVHWPTWVHGAWRGADAVPPCDRCRPDRARGRGASAPDHRRRRRSASDRGREHALLVRRRNRGRSPRHPVLRDVLQPRHLPRGLDCGHPPLDTLGDGQPLPPFDDDVWELYEPGDWSQAHDLAAEMPEKLAELQQLWLDEARKHNVLPLDDRRIERFNAELVGRPELVKGNSQLLFGGMGRLTESSLLNIKNKSHAVTAEVVVPETGAEGVIIAQGGAFAGWSLYAKDGRPKYCYNLLGLQRFKIEADAAIPPGTHQVRMEFAYDGGGLAKGGTVTLYLDGDQVGEGRVEATVPMIFSADETADVGRDTASPVSDDYDGREQRLHRHGQLGADRPRRGRRGRRPPDHARGAPARRDGAPVRRSQPTRPDGTAATTSATRTIRARSYSAISLRTATARTQPRAARARCSKQGAAAHARVENDMAAQSEIGSRWKE